MIEIEIKKYEDELEEIKKYEKAKEDKKERKGKKEAHWAMMKWVVNYIDENQEDWDLVRVQKLYEEDEKRKTEEMRWRNMDKEDKSEN